MNNATLVNALQHFDANAEVTLASDVTSHRTVLVVSEETGTAQVDVCGDLCAMPLHTERYRNAKFPYNRCGC